MTAGTHVVFGTGPAEPVVATALFDQGTQIRSVPTGLAQATTRKVSS